MDRLNTICQMIDPTFSAIDVGCDHGILSKMLLDSGKVQQMFCSDISLPSLEKAKILLSKYSNVKFLHGDGLSVLDDRVDTVIIAGMGGLNIIDIISSANFDPIYVLSPHRNASDVRQYLIKNGYKIQKDCKIFDKNKYYDIIVSEPGEMKLDDYQIHLGVFYKTKNEILRNYLDFMLSKYENYPKTDKNINLLNIIKEGLKWQK